MFCSYILSIYIYTLTSLIHKLTYLHTACQVCALCCERVQCTSYLQCVLYASVFLYIIFRYICKTHLISIEYIVYRLYIYDMFVIYSILGIDMIYTWCFALCSHHYIRYFFKSCFPLTMDTFRNLRDTHFFPKSTTTRRKRVSQCLGTGVLPFLISIIFELHSNQKKCCTIHHFTPSKSEQCLGHHGHFLRALWWPFCRGPGVQRGDLRWSPGKAYELLARGCTLQENMEWRAKL